MIIFIFLKLMRKRLTTHIGPNLSIDSTGTQQELDRKVVVVVLLVFVFIVLSKQDSAR